MQQSTCGELRPQWLCVQVSAFPVGALVWELSQTWSLWHCPFFLLGPSAVASGWGPAELLIHRRGSARIDFCPGLHSYVQSLLNFARGNELLSSSSSLSKFLHRLPFAGRHSSMAWLPDHLVLSSTLCSAVCNHPAGCPSMAGAQSFPCWQVPRVTSENWPNSPSSREPCGAAPSQRSIQLYGSRILGS